MALTDQLISFYELEEVSGQRNDAHGTNHLTDNNTVTQATGKVGQGADFEQDNFEYLSRATGLLDGLSDFSISFWAKAETTGASHAAFGQGDGDAATGTFFEATRLFVSGSLGDVDLAFANPFSTTQFDHFIITRSTTLVEIYKNNSLHASQADSSRGTVVAAATHGFAIGAAVVGTGGSFRSFDGVLDQFGLWSRVLDSGERASLYNSGNGLAYAAMSGGGVANPAFAYAQQ